MHYLGGRPSESLLKASLDIFDNKVCVDAYGTERTLKNGIIDSQLCAGDLTGERDTCQVSFIQ